MLVSWHIQICTCLWLLRCRFCVDTVIRLKDCTMLADEMNQLVTTKQFENIKRMNSCHN